MEYLHLLLLGVVCYLIGGFNPSILLSKTVYHQDIRTLGSGNPGFTNFKRNYGWKWGWLVLLTDICKTVLPVVCSCFLMVHWHGEAIWPLTAAFCGLCVMFGHAFPVWFGFRGGKAFVTCWMTVFLVDWRAGLVFIGVFLLLLFTVKYMSLSSMTAAASYPVSMLIFRFGDWLLFVLALIAAILVIGRHHANIRRLLDGKESKFHLFRDKE